MEAVLHHERIKGIGPGSAVFTFIKYISSFLNSKQLFPLSLDIHDANNQFKHILSHILKQWSAA